MYVCVSFLYKICTQSTPGLGRDGSDQIKHRKKNQKYSDSSTGFSEERRGKNHICVCHLFQLRWEKRTRLLSPPPAPRWVELTLKHQFLNTEPSQIARVFLFPFLFFLFKLIGFSLSCFFLFFFVLSPAWVRVFVGFFVYPLAVPRQQAGAGFRIAPCRFSLYSSFSSSSSGSETRF